MNLNINYEHQREELITQAADWAQNLDGLKVVSNDFDGFDIMVETAKRWSGVRIAYESDQLKVIQFVNNGGEFATSFTGLVSLAMITATAEAYISGLKVAA